MITGKDLWKKIEDDLPFHLNYQSKQELEDFFFTHIPQRKLVNEYMIKNFTEALYQEDISGIDRNHGKIQKMQNLLKSSI